MTTRAGSGWTWHNTGGHERLHFIVDPNTPPYSDKAKLNMFEPQLIKDIQTHIRATAKSNIGTMAL